MQYFKNYPLNRLWYLVFDYNRRNLGPGAFANTAQQGAEVGYLAGMFSGLNFVFESIDAPLSPAFLEILHDTITQIDADNNDVVLHIKGNPAIANLLVYQAASAVDHWNEVNVTDRLLASNQIAKQIWVQMPEVKFSDVEQLIQCGRFYILPI